ncbi:MAG TPA: hypothetical protein DCM71_24055 [Runella sp.]|nr:hypothetical protein [Runella sp.]
MKIFTSPEHFTFTNHFNQSLLKNRIAMMNKRKSNWKAFGKYGLFIASIWVCAAFTKPYRTKVAAQIVEKVPELKLVLQPEIIEKPALNDFVLEKPLNQPSKDSLQVTVNMPSSAEVDTQKLVSSTKYVFYEGNYLHWLITPKTTLEDLVDMKKEFAKHNLFFSVSELKLDPLNLFITGVTAKGYRSENSGCMIGAHITDNSIEPIPSRGGYISFGQQGSCGTTVKANMRVALKEVAEQDEKAAQEEWKKNSIKYLEVQITNSLGSGGSSTYLKQSLIDTKALGATTQRINLTNNGLIAIAEAHKNDIVLLNGKPSTIEEIEKVTIQNFNSAIFKETWEKDKNQRKNYILIFTE